MGLETEMKKFIETAKAYNKILEKQNQELQKKYNRYMKTQTGRIYKLTSEQTDKIYIGSTFNKLKYRFSEHKYNYNQWQKGKANYYTSFEICKYKDCKIELVAEYSNVTKAHLEKEEGEIITNEKNAINQRVAGCGFSECPKEYQKQYYIYNGQKLKQLNKQYYANNCEKIKQHQNEKLTCDICNGSFTRGNKQQHRKTKKHKRALENTEN